MHLIFYDELTRMNNNVNFLSIQYRFEIKQFLRLSLTVMSDCQFAISDFSLLKNRFLQFTITISSIFSF